MNFWLILLANVGPMLILAVNLIMQIQHRKRDQQRFERAEQAGAELIQALHSQIEAQEFLLTIQRETIQTLNRSIAIGNEHVAVLNESLAMGNELVAIQEREIATQKQHIDLLNQRQS